MQIFNQLPREDVELLHAYLDGYSDGPAIAYSHMDYFLRHWDEAKAPFYHMFGDKFIIKQELSFERAIEEMEEEMEAIFIDDHIRTFVRNYKQAINLVFAHDFDARCELYRFVDSDKMLVTNVYNGPAITIPGDFTIDGHPLQINRGCKVIKMLGKIAKALNVMDGYEELRRAHSLVLNQKKIKGNLCLSIHPLDFLTMSDNECGWSSCMSWVDEYGDYRLGTIEMMNSPCVVIAYVEANTPMSLCGSEWNNKRWRQLFIVTPDLILGNKQYPYKNAVLQGCAIKWLREMCSKTLGYGPYPEEANEIRNGKWNDISGSDTQVKIVLTTSYMYNDVYDTRLAFVNPNISEVYRLNFSGVATCTGCGEIIEYESVEPHEVRCRSCNGLWQCDCCHEWTSGDAYYDANDNAYCSWCYYHELDQCECCGDRGRDFSHHYVHIIDKADDELSSFNWNYHITLCDCCQDDPEEYEPLFGPLTQHRDDYGVLRDCFDLQNITDEGLSRGDLSIETQRSLRQIRDARSLHERANLIRNIFLY